MAKKQQYETLSYRGKWNRWKRRPDLWPHPGREQAVEEAKEVELVYPSKVPPKTFYCWYCAGEKEYRKRQCRECGKCYEQQRAKVIVAAMDSWDLSVVFKNAKRQGYDPYLAVCERKHKRKSLGYIDYRNIDKKLTQYLRQRKADGL